VLRALSPSRRHRLEQRVSTDDATRPLHTALGEEEIARIRRGRLARLREEMTARDIDRLLGREV
jgi:hypothetical protein